MCQLTLEFFCLPKSQNLSSEKLAIRQYYCAFIPKLLTFILCIKYSRVGYPINIILKTLYL